MQKIVRKRTAEQIETTRRQAKVADLLDILADAEIVEDNGRYLIDITAAGNANWSAAAAKVKAAKRS